MGATLRPGVARPTEAKDPRAYEWRALNPAEDRRCDGRPGPDWVIGAGPPQVRGWHGLGDPFAGVITPPPPVTSGRRTLAGTKYFLDGTQVERGAAVSQPYADSGTHGALDWSDADVHRMVDEARRTGDVLHVHAVGDRAIHQLLDALGTPAPVTLEHGDALAPADLPRLRALGIVVVQNPFHFDPALPNAQRLGDRPWIPLASLLAAGIPLALGSDGPLNPFGNIARAIDHGTESLTREQAVAAYTHGSAMDARCAGENGRLAPVLLADLAVLSRDIFTIPARDLAGTRATVTVIGGRVAAGQLACERTGR